MAASTVLVVDDEPLILEFLSENLRADDFSVLTAATGAEAMRVLAGSRPDVLLLDVVLPDMTGYDVCKAVRGGDAVTDGWDADVPIIMLSAKAEHTDRVRGLTRGADDYVTNPIQYPDGRREFIGGVSDSRWSLRMAILDAVDAATPNWGRLKVVCGFLIWGLSLVAGGWLIADSWHDASTRRQIEAVSLVVGGIGAGLWNARQIPRRARHPIPRREFVVSTVGVALGLKVIADGLAPDQRLVFNAAIFAVLAFFTVSLPTAWREQRRRERADREWSAYTDHFKGAGYATRRDWPPGRSRN